MMVDTSAVVAIMRGEPEAKAIVSAIENAPRAFMSAPSYLELCMVVSGNKVNQALQKVQEALHELGITVVAFTPDMAQTAAAAFIKYGKGQGHPAQLNFGDCMSYAASKVEAMPLLFKGDDLRLTDVECAI